FQISAVQDYLEAAFPPRLPRLQHVVINQQARELLAWRKGLPSVLIPNVLDFDNPPPPPDDFGADIPAELGLQPGDRMILQPTRIVPRKGIEHAITLLRRLKDPHLKLVISHPAGDEGREYQEQLMELATDEGVDVRLFGDRVADLRQVSPDGRKTYVLKDLYPHADLVCFPSLYEGFGNALLEAIYFRKPVFINRYDVYIRDIEPKGLRLPAIDGFVNRSVVREVRRLLDDPAHVEELVEHNYQIARKYYSYRVLRYGLQGLINNIHHRTE
ncbi:MAG TPA: glycosyltransferase, partial [Thiotrichales bacterium]|nr:glycosyltransferase [Thiotrichales bacterium]